MAISLARFQTRPFIWGEPVLLPDWRLREGGKRSRVASGTAGYNDKAATWNFAIGPFFARSKILPAPQCLLHRSLMARWRHVTSSGVTASYRLTTCLCHLTPVWTWWQLVDTAVICSFIHSSWAYGVGLKHCRGCSVGNLGCLDWSGVGWGADAIPCGQNPSCNEWLVRTGHVWIL